MRHTLHLEITRTRGALLRVLALLERRRFAVHLVEAGPLLAAADDSRERTATVALTVSGATAIPPLTHKLLALVDVHSVHTTPATAPDREER